MEPTFPEGGRMVLFIDIFQAGSEYENKMALAVTPSTPSPSFSFKYAGWISAQQHWRPLGTLHTGGGEMCEIHGEIE